MTRPTHRTLATTLATLTMLAWETIPGPTHAATSRPMTMQEWLHDGAAAAHGEEQWLVLLRSEDGTIVELRLRLANLAVVAAEAVVELVIVPKEGETERHQWSYTASELAQNEATGRIVLAKHSLALLGRSFQAQMRTDGLTLEVEGESWSDSLTVGDGRLVVREDPPAWVATFLAVPQGRFKGVLRRGVRRTELKGDFLVVRTTQNVRLDDVAARAWLCHAATADAALSSYALRRSAALGGGIVGIGARLRRDPPTADAFAPKLAVTPPEVEERHPAPASVHLEAAEPVGLTMNIEGFAPHGLDAPLTELNWLERQLEKSLSGGFVVTWSVGTAKGRLAEDWATDLTAPALLRTTFLDGGRKP